MRVDIWSDIVCPWCYVGKRRFETALATFQGSGDLEIVHHSFQLNPAAPRDRTTDRREMLMQKYGWTKPQMDAMDVRMTQVAADEGLDYRLDGTMTGNTHDAHQLVHLARERGRQDEMVERLYRAYFSEQRSVFDRESLAAIASESGLDRDAVLAALNEGRYSAAVNDDIAAAKQLGITGVPFFVIAGRYGVSGAQSPDVFVDALKKGELLSAPRRLSPL
jgi:predicted DsbA family dithiol-disulfide isomerase